ncbi:MAG: YbaK/prolyl-tRNA synthetase associated domain-containing protein [Burkholderiales bacterium]|jgi:Ala-tRNA(Pro) deacylase|nr:YbaK/prolyl-tRNA synthetase associated domain-containing protein [Burkholderiales bacterium]
MSLATFEKLTALFSLGNAHFETLAHEPVRTSEEAAAVRGTALQQGAKAMVCRIKISSNERFYALAVFPADNKLNFDSLAAVFGGKKASLATPEEATRLTDCEPGAVPPVSFHPELTLVVDRSLLTRNQTISFNAGLRDRSMMIGAADYQRIVEPLLAEIVV